MFLKFRVRGAVAEIMRISGCVSCRCLPFFEVGLDEFMPQIKRSGFDEYQGAVTVMTGMIVELFKNDAARKHIALSDYETYADLRKVWAACERLVEEDPGRWGKTFIGGNLEKGKNPFESPVDDSWVYLNSLGIY